MAVQSLVEQHIIFISPTNQIDDASILANSLIQTLAANSVGNDLVVSIQGYQHWTGSAWVFSSFYEIKCYVTTAFQATIQSNIPTLQTDFPQYTIVTWGGNVAFGN